MPLTLNGTTGIAGVDGTAGTPAVKGSDTDTGIVYGTNTVQIATNGTTAVTVDASQNVGVGTATPGQKLDVNGNVRSKSSTGGVFNLDSTTTGTANTIGSYANNGAAFADINYSGNQHLWLVAGSEKARIDSNGYLLVGYTSSNGAYKLQVNSQIFATSAIIATSDARYKENVEPITDGLALVNALNPVSFDWKQHPIHAFDTEHKTVGFLAQEVQTALADKPYVNSIIKESECELPDGTKEKFLGIAEGNMVSILTSAIKELSAKLDAATARIAALEAK